MTAASAEAELAFADVVDAESPELEVSSSDHVAATLDCRAATLDRRILVSVPSAATTTHMANSAPPITASTPGTPS